MSKKNFSDWAVALTVVGCSVILFLALLFSLTGASFGKPSRTLKVNFHDVTGVNLSANVKYAGAMAGKVTSIRMLSPQERISSGDPLNAVQVEVALNDNVPPLPEDIVASVAADTLLSDKFILLNGGSATAPEIPNHSVVQGITPVTFDKLTRNLDSVVEGIATLLRGTKGDASDIFERLRALLDDTQNLVKGAQPVLVDVQQLINDAKPVVVDARALTSDARQLIAENKEPITRTINTLGKATVSFDKLVNRSNALIAGQERNISQTLSDFRVTAENLKVTSVYAKVLTRTLAQRPSQIIWGGKPIVIPTEQQILQDTKPRN